MRYKVAILLVLFSFTIARNNANPVSRMKAITVAENFLKQKTGKSHLKAALLYEKDRCFYVFGFDPGFVIIAADDRAIPVLGYSAEGRFVVPDVNDTVTSAAFLSWMRFWQSQMQYLREHMIEATEEISIQWDNLLAGKTLRNTTTVVDPMLTTTWGQLWPYNSLCPADSNGSGGHVAAGCGPLAMAQILKYHNYPPQGLGSYGYTLGAYPYSGAGFGSTTYQWDSMPNSITSVHEEVATIIYHAGVSVHAEWSPGGTTSGSSTIMMALVNYFRMAYANMRYVSKYAYSESGWNTLIQNELLAGRPVYYQGFGTNGHAFVCDGVDGSNLYHFNWGWNGLYNGYYALNDLTPGPYNFTYGQGAIIGIEPNDGTTLVEDTTWSDTVNCLTSIAVPYAITLTLNPGSTIRFEQNCKLKVWGRVLSPATSDAYTKLTATDVVNGWDGIDWLDDFARMSENDSSKLVYTQVEYSKSAAIECSDYGKVLLDHCKINNNFAEPGIMYAGIRCSNKPVNVVNSEIFNNAAGGISITNTGELPARISGNAIYNNGNSNGGGIRLINTKVTVSDNLIHHNNATNAGGGLYVSGGLPEITGNRFINNTAILYGGGLFLDNSNPKITSNLLANNTAGDSLFGAGGAIACFMNASPVLISNTIVNNYAQSGGGINFLSECYPLVKNCILYGNQAVSGPQIALEDPMADPVIDHCDIEGGIAGFGGSGSGNEYDPAGYTNNLDTLPGFLSPSSGAGTNFDGLNAAWQLQSGLPCINAGDTAGISVLLPEHDLDGNPRINGILDMGAWEYYLTIPETVEVGDDTIETGTFACYNAAQTITVGGNGTSFSVQSGAEVTLLAGQKISLLAGTVAEAGSYLQGLITPGGPWCQNPALPSSSGAGSLEDGPYKFLKIAEENILLYPNPCSGIIHLEIFNLPAGEKSHILCYNTNGTCVLELTTEGGIRKEIDLTGQLPGVYLLIIRNDHAVFRKKVIRME